MAITAAQVKELREMTGAGMMDCKKALTATDDDCKQDSQCHTGRRLKLYSEMHQRWKLTDTCLSDT